MELRHLRYFVAVAEERHFGRAAARLHMAQPPLSQQIQRLEAELGVALLSRSTRRVDLTPAGGRFLDRARAILASAESAAAEAARVAAGEVGRVAVGFVGTATYAVLPALASAVRAAAPGLDLDLRGEQLTPALIGGLHDRSLDVAIIRPPVGDPDLDVRVLRRERLVAVLPETHPLAAADHVDLAALEAERFLCYPSHHRSVMYELVLDACHRAGFRPRRVQEIAETSTLVVTVAAGLGVALVPDAVRSLEIAGAAYRPLLQDEEVELAVATRAGERSPHVRRVLEVLPSVLAPRADGAR
ncbi:LysR substrate-binding domain-containing protein [Jiangella endophytica]|uniref:LysR substrate-binding domain-containing protein n=1 Tax=Jiangella endophytica TaxID=1623398 RepID=UPI000E34B29D|nr:LysR substrate-binding domain-containing protein [Jiangella endophytica]